MQTALIIIGITSASLAGSAFGYWSLEQVEQRSCAHPISCKQEQPLKDRLSVTCTYVVLHAR